MSEEVKRVCRPHNPMASLDVIAINSTGDTTWYLVDEGDGPDWVESFRFIETAAWWTTLRAEERSQLGSSIDELVQLLDEIHDAA